MLASPAPAVLHLRRGDPLPPLPGLALGPGQWTLLLSLDAVDVSAAFAAVDELCAELRGVTVALLVRGATTAAAALCVPDALGIAADRLGALADVTGARAAIVVLVEPRGTVQASIVGCDTAALRAALSALAT